jgi:tape measure domain-containing protein
MSDLDLKIKITSDNKSALDAFVALSKKVKATEDAFKKAEKEFNTLATELKNSEKPSAQLKANYEKAEQALKTLEQQNVSYRQELSKQETALQSAGVEVNDLASAYQKLSDQESLDAAFKDLDMRPLKEANADIQRLQESYDTLAKSGKVSVNELAIAKTKLAEKTRVLKAETSSLSQAFGSLQQRWLSIAATLAGVVTVFGRVSRAGQELEGVQVQLKAIFGSSDEAAKALTFIGETADKLGLEVSSLNQGFAKLAASARNTALEGQPLRDIFQGVAEAASVMNLSVEDTEGVILALAQMMSKGKVSSEEFRQQFAERIPQATQVAAEALGVTTAEFINMLESGSLLTEEFLPKLIGQLRENIKGGLDESAESTRASFNRLNNATLRLAQNFASVVNPALASVSDGLSAILEAINNLTPFTKVLLGAVTALAAGFTAWLLAIKPLVALLSGAFLTAMTGATVASGEFALALRAIPFVAVAIAIAEGGRLLGLWGKSAEAATQKTEKMSDGFKTLKGSVSGIAQTIANELTTLRSSLADVSSDLASSFDEVVDRAGNSYTQRLVNIERTTQEQIAKIRNDRTASDKERVDREIDAVVMGERKKLAAVETYQKQIVLAIEASYDQIVATAGQGSEEVKQFEAEAKRYRLETYREVEQAYRQTIDNLIAEEQRHYDEVARLEDQRRLLKMSVEDQIREIQRRGMSDYQARQDEIRQIDEKQAEARKALARGDFEEAERLGREALQLSARIGNEVTETVKQNGETVTKTVISQAKASTKAIDEMRQSSSLVDQALAQNAKSHQAAGDAAKTQADTASSALDKLKSNIADLQAQIAQENTLQLTIKTNEAIDAIAEIGKLVETQKLVAQLEIDTRQAEKDYDIFRQSDVLDNPIIIKHLKVQNEALAGGVREIQDFMNDNELDISAKIALDPIREQIATIRIELEEPTQSDHTVKPDTTQAQNAINALKQPTSSTHTVYVQEVIQRAAGGLVKKFASGGKVTGPGTATSDSIPALLSNGEFVMQAKAVQQYGLGFFNALNQGLMSIPKFASGGEVGRVASTPASPRSDVNLNFNIGSNTYTVQSSREVAMSLTTALRDLARVG